FQGVTKIIEHRLVSLKQGASLVQNKDMLGKKIYELAKLPLILPQLFFCLLAILYIRAGPVPPDNFPAFVAERFHPNKKPPINAIIAANTRLDFAWFSRDQ